MSYSTAIYAVDLQLLESSFGSKDVDMLRHIKRQYGHLFQEADEWFDDKISQGVPTLEEAIAELIEGTLTAPALAAFQHGYALEMLCRHFGARLNSDALGMIEGMGVAERLALSGPPIAIPRSEDFPVIGYMTYQQTVAELQRMEGKTFSYTDKYVETAHMQLKSCLEEAERRRVGLVAFCY